jgi:NADPH-dependent 2,4-dienoyl-CoA reductase/sulfur reductase-like enzyme
MTRAHMADPHIMRKIVEKREHDIRPCTGATYCLDRIYQGGMALCIHNPSTGREETMPHEIVKADRKRTVVIVGAGPAGLEAARVAGERGHDVTVIEAAPKAGGQLLLTAQNPRRREMMSIAEWRLAQCEALGVKFNYSTWAEAQTVTALNPDVVIIATGGLPHADGLRAGADLTVTSWDIISGDVKPGSNILIYDDAGDHAALQAAEVAAKSGSKVEIMTRDRSFSPEVMAMNLVPYMRELQKRDVTFTVTYMLDQVHRGGNHGTKPNTDLYFALKPLSSNLGEVDYKDFIFSKPQNRIKNAAGTFQLFRIGDAVAARNTHAAIYDALRLVRNV